MIRPHILTTALLVLSVMPAAAADRPARAPWVAPVTGPAVIYAAPPVAVAPYRYAVRHYEGAPYFVVDQGPEYSGPNITVTEITWTNTDVHSAYPYIGSPYPYIGASGPAISSLASVRHVAPRRVVTRAVYARPTHRRPGWTSSAMHRPTRVAVHHTIKVHAKHSTSKPATSKSETSKPVDSKPTVAKPTAKPLAKPAT